MEVRGEEEGGEVDKEVMKRDELEDKVDKTNKMLKK